MQHYVIFYFSIIIWYLSGKWVSPAEIINKFITDGVTDNILSLFWLNITQVLAIIFIIFAIRNLCGAIKEFIRKKE